MVKKTLSEQILHILHQNASPSGMERISLILLLSFPAIVAQIASVVMQYIDASMVGQLGAADSASIGLVASSIWLFFSIGMAVNIGFTVLVAQKIGAKNFFSARNLLKTGFIVSGTVSVILSLIGIAVSDLLPAWLGGSAEIHDNARNYFLVVIAGLPVFILNSLSSGFLQSSGNMKIPSILNVAMCVFDVIFNYLFIFPSHEFSVGTVTLIIPGFDLGVIGAALGTLAAVMLSFSMMLYFLLFKSEKLKLHKNERFVFSPNLLRKSFLISAPVGFDHVAMCGAMVVSMMIVSPLGTIPIATHSFAITAESFCYMIGFGIASAATTLVGQSIGARRTDLAISFSWMVTGLGVAFMTVAGILMFIFAPLMIGMLSPVQEIRELGADVLRIEAFAEPFYGASIVISGAVRGAGDTLYPSIFNFVSIWFVRIPLSLILVNLYGFYGVWLAMSIELCVRGILFLIHLKRRKWLRGIKLQTNRLQENIYE